MLYAMLNESVLAEFEKIDFGPKFVYCKELFL
jgi:hypothetical protein